MHQTASCCCLDLQDGVQPLHICAEKGHREVAAVLIKAGAAPNTKDAVSSKRKQQQHRQQ
jgi:ankyrin repeat protein